MSNCTKRAHIIIIIIAQANEVLFPFFSFGFASIVNEPVKSVRPSVRLSVWVQCFIQLTNGLPGYFVRNGNRLQSPNPKKETSGEGNQTHETLDE